MTGRAIIIDDHRLFGAGMRELMISLPEIDDALYFDSPANALSSGAENVTLVMADFYIPGFPAAEWLPQLKSRFRKALLVVVSSSHSRTDRDISESAGAVAFFEKHQHPEHFVLQLQKLLRGGNAETPAPSDPSGKLSPRQLDILVELTRGAPSKAIARHLGLSPETVKTHLSRLYREIDVAGRDEAVQWAHENGII